MDMMLKWVFTPSLKNIEPAGDLEAWSIANFKKLDPQTQARCTAHLREILQKSVPALAMWCYQLGKGARIGSDDMRFHLGTGMAVRNALRDVIRDDKLPPVEQPGGDFAQNWDDYYYGALHCALMEEIENGQ